jgi:hypothetical protein
MIRESGPCFAVGYRFLCSEALQCAHIITRARRPTRWSSDNAVPLCGGHHVWFTHNPEAWRSFIVDKGLDYDELHRRAWNDPPQDPLAIIAELSAA